MSFYSPEPFNLSLFILARKTQDIRHHTTDNKRLHLTSDFRRETAAQNYAKIDFVQLKSRGKIRGRDVDISQRTTTSSRHHVSKQFYSCDIFSKEV